MDAMNDGQGIEAETGPDSKTVAEADSIAAVERADFTPAGRFAPGNSFAWKRGMSGNSNGRRGAITDRIRERLDEIMPGDEGNRRRKQVIADVLVDLACAGNLQAIREVLDRSDGKVTQRLEVEGDPNRMSDEEIEEALIAAGVDIRALTEAMDKKDAQLLEAAGDVPDRALQGTVE